MIFIVGNLMILGLVLSYIAYKFFVERVLPAILRSKHARRFKQRISFYIRRFFFDMFRDSVAHLVTLCESDGDEPFQPYLDSPLRTCPPCEFVSSPAKQGVLEETNNNRLHVPATPPPIPAARRGGRGRARAAVRRVIIPAPPAIRLPGILQLQQAAGVGRGGGAQGPPPSPPLPIRAVARALVADLDEDEFLP